jgi:hypothetical protein
VDYKTLLPLVCKFINVSINVIYTFFGTNQITIKLAVNFGTSAKKVLKWLR